MSGTRGHRKRWGSLKRALKKQSDTDRRVVERHLLHLVLNGYDWDRIAWPRRQRNFVCYWSIY